MVFSVGKYMCTMEQCLSKERVWFDQQRYEKAEASYQRVLAERHAGLRVEVSVQYGPSYQLCSVCLNRAGPLTSKAMH